MFDVSMISMIPVMDVKKRGPKQLAVRWNSRWYFHSTSQMLAIVQLEVAFHIASDILTASVMLKAQDGRIGI